MFSNLIEVFLVFLRLGLTSFGGPVAHLGYFHDEFVLRKKWMDEHSFADLVALCQVLPGPASSQVGMAIGLARAGYLGAVVAWAGFTLPSAIALVLFALGISKYQIDSSWLHGLKIAAAAVVAQAIWVLFPKLCPDKPRIAIAIVIALIAAATNSAPLQVLLIAIGGVLGLAFLRQSRTLPLTPSENPVSARIGGLCLIIFLTLLFLLPFGATATGDQSIRLFDSFFRAGSLVFGGGHVVLPLLQAEVVPPGWVTKEIFMAGYGAAQAVPGPLFTFSAYLGAASQVAPSGWLGATICLIATFLPSFLLIVGVLPFWDRLRIHSKIRYAMLGINASVVGLLLAAFYNPVWTSAIFSFKDFALALLGFALLTFAKAPSWAVVIGCAVCSGVFL